MKKLINDPHTVVGETMAGFALAHPDLVRLNADPLYLVRVDAPIAGKVALVSGGGSGHEPLHVGFVGDGMLDAAAPGPIFTSPTPDRILAAAKAADSGRGVLLIVKNYTGDVLNFETAADFAAADGVAVRTLVVADDVSTSGEPGTPGRRGVAGAVVVEKILGAAARRGDSLDELLALGERVAAAVRSFGVALRPPVQPYTGLPSFELDEDEIEFGIGIHGEPGRAKLPLKPVDALVDDMVEVLLEDGAAVSGDEVLLLVNGMGGTPEAELYLVLRRAVAAFAERGIRVARTLLGSYVTSLEMQGFSLSVLPLDEETTALWDAPVHTAALRW